MQRMEHCPPAESFSQHFKRGSGISKCKRLLWRSWARCAAWTVHVLATRRRVLCIIMYDFEAQQRLWEGKASPSSNCRSADCFCGSRSAPSRQVGSRSHRQPEIKEQNYYKKNMCFRFPALVNGLDRFTGLGGLSHWLFPEYCGRFVFSSLSEHCLTFLIYNLGKEM